MEQASQAALIDKIDDDNPFTAVAAFRALLDRGSGAATARDALSRATGWRQAIFVNLLLIDADEGDRADLIEIVDELVSRASSADDLVPVALGAFSLPYSKHSLPGLPLDQFPVARELREDVLELIRAHPILWNETESARYIDSILEKVGKRRQ